MKTDLRQARRRRIRQRISGTAARPRVSVHRSARYISVQLVDDTTGTTLLAASTNGSTEEGKIAQAEGLGKAIAAQATKAGITSVVFDRSGYLYHGRIKALAEGLRAGGLEF